MSAFTGILNRYGESAVLYSGEDAETIKVFIQPVMGNEYTAAWSEITRLGEKNPARYYCFSETGLGKGSYLICDGISYDVVKSEKYKVAGRVSHWESVLKRRLPERS